LHEEAIAIIPIAIFGNGDNEQRARLGIMAEINKWGGEYGL
jgi:hypothetical protein